MDCCVAVGAIILWHGITFNIKKPMIINFLAVKQKKYFKIGDFLLDQKDEEKPNLLFKYFPYIKLP